MVEVPQRSNLVCVCADQLWCFRFVTLGTMHCSCPRGFIEFDEFVGIDGRISIPLAHSSGRGSIRKTSCIQLDESAMCSHHVSVA
jgi:hypothetical protein